MKETNKLGVNLDDILGLIKFGKKDCPCPKKKHKTKSETVGASKPVTFSNRGTRYSGTSNGVTRISGTSNSEILNNIGNTTQNDIDRINNDIARYELNNAVPWKNNQFVQAKQPQNRFGNEILMMPQLKKPNRFSTNSFRRMGDENYEPVEGMGNSSISPLTPFKSEVYDDDTVTLYEDDEEDPYDNDVEEEYNDDYDYNNRQQGDVIFELPTNKNSPVVSYRNIELGNIYPNDEISNPQNEMSNPQNEMSNPQYKEDEEMIEMVANPLHNKKKFVRSDEPNPLVTNELRGLVQRGHVKRSAEKIEKIEKQMAGKLTSNKPNRLTNLTRPAMLQRLEEYNRGISNKDKEFKYLHRKNVYELEKIYIQKFGMPKNI